MSMNIYIFAEREITFRKKDGTICTESQIQKFNALQTPTQITYMILKSENPKQSYIDWVLAECSHDEEEAVYAENDIFQEQEPIGVEIYNAGKEHVQNFLQWCDTVEDNGYTILFEMV